MKTKKRFFLLALSMLFFANVHNINAQVTIGAETAPESYSLLELNTTTVKGGVQLPKLTTTERDALLSSKTTAQKLAAKGLTVFNTTTNCTDTWNGTAWISNCSNNTAPQITTQPRAFNWAETTSATTMMGVDAAGTANLNSSTISVVATGVGTLTYQWYEVPMNQNSAPTKITTNGTSASYTPSLSALGMRRYFCRITDGNNNTVDSDIAVVAVGCGAKTVQDGWLTFMCYNLGATIADKSIAAQKAYSSPAFTYNGSTYTPISRDNNSVVYGDLYQWGRAGNGVGDGHEKRTSGTVATQVSGASAGHANFIRGFANWTTSISVDLNWRNQKNVTYDPCPSGWRVPSQYEWLNIFNGNSTAASASASANTWSWYSGATDGYEIKPDGLTTTLFLPAAGTRHYSDGELYNVGTDGYYWSGTIASTYSLYLYFTSTIVYPASFYDRAYGFSVRCVSEL